MKKILIVDDEPDLLDLIELILTNEGYEVNKAQNGKTAVELASKNDYDLIIMDIMMPEMDGWETIKTIRAEKKNLNLPVVMLTCRDNSQDKYFAIQEGVEDYVTKPFTPNQLVSIIENIFA